MKLYFSKGWLKRKIEEMDALGIEEPHCIGPIEMPKFEDLQKRLEARGVRSIYFAKSAGATKEELERDIVIVLNLMLSDHWTPALPIGDSQQG